MGFVVIHNLLLNVSFRLISVTQAYQAENFRASIPHLQECIAGQVHNERLMEKLACERRQHRTVFFHNVSSSSNLKCKVRQHQQMKWLLSCSKLIRSLSPEHFIYTYRRVEGT